MAQDQGIRARKGENFSEWYTQIVDKADLADIRYNVQGFIVHKTWSTKILKEMIRLFEAELEKTGHEPVLFPTVIPEENLKKEGDHFGFVPEVFWVTEKGVGEKLEKKLALRPTSETAFYQMYSLWIRSWRDLPMKKYQTVTVFRNEPVTRPFLRGREFIFMEAHDAFETHAEAERQIEQDKDNMKNVIWERLGIPIMFFRRPQWDKFLGADETYATDTLLPDGKVLQVGSTHDLGQKFSKTFGIKFADKEEKENNVWQTCYGPGIWRIFAALVSVHGDDKGLVLPFEIAPIQIMIIPIFYNDDDKKAVMKKCEKVKKSLSDYRVSIDDSGKTPGEKYHHWEMFGIPVRIEIGGKEAAGDFVTVYRRDLMLKEKVTDKALEKHLKKLPEEILETLKKKAKAFIEENVHSPKNRHDFLRDVSKTGIIHVPFCGTEECARTIQNDTKGIKVRGVSTEKKEKAIGNCIYCNRVAKEVVYMAKQY
jgi:prolyl-tRNA synthetase